MVTSLAEVWIEITDWWNALQMKLRHFPCGSVDWNRSAIKAYTYEEVTSLAEVWIEIFFRLAIHYLNTCHFPCGSVDWNLLHSFYFNYSILSLPLRKCGLKFSDKPLSFSPVLSLPLRKCGLKSSRTELLRQVGLVTSLAEVWIEIYMKEKLWSTPWSLPLRKCGLKSPLLMCWVISVLVTSLAEVWIEIYALTL